MPQDINRRNVLSLFGRGAAGLGLAGAGGQIMTSEAASAMASTRNMSGLSKSPPLAQTETGVVVGDRIGDIRRFLGIPYAAPPIGPLRWRAPQPLSPWQGVLPATSFGPGSFQGAAFGQPESYSEDCLTLNIWTPATSPAKRLPVMVWIHGGGYLAGSSAIPEYDGSAIAEKDVVLISINYRLHVFGYLAHPSIGGNFGLQDQLAALRWIQANVAQFGGDPDNVTIFGESAGADAVSKLLASVEASPFFDKAIMQSGGFGPPASGEEGIDYERAVEVAERLLVELNCTDFEKARALPAPLVWKAADRISGINMTSGRITTPSILTFYPVIDNRLAPFQNGITVKSEKPVLIGYNKNEARFFAIPDRTYSEADLNDLLNRVSHHKQDEVKSLLEEAAPDALYEQIDRLFTTMVFEEPTLAFAKDLKQAGHSVFLYHFSRVSPQNRENNLLASHGNEIPYVFGTLDAEGNASIDHAISGEMQTAWTSFAQTGRPSTGVGPWPSMTEERFPPLTEIGDTVAFSSVTDSPLLRAAQSMRSDS